MKLLSPLVCMTVLFACLTIVSSEQKTGRTNQRSNSTTITAAAVKKAQPAAFSYAKIAQLHAKKTETAQQPARNQPLVAAGSTVSTLKKDDKLNKPSKPQAQSTPPAIVYSQRVLKWFDGSFTYTDQDPKGIYHTLLPLEYDSYVVKYGKKSFVVGDLSAVKAQSRNEKPVRDCMYRIYGIVRHQDNLTDYYEFHATIQENGLCYHRGGKRLHKGYETFINSLHSQKTVNTVPEEKVLLMCKLPISIINREKFDCTIELYQPLEK